MLEPRYYRARVALLKELIQKEIDLYGTEADASESRHEAGGSRSRSGDDKKSKLIPILRSGKFPESLKSQELLILEKQKDFSNEPLSHLELVSFNTHFAIHPERVAGTEVDGSGFLNPIEIEGTYEDALRVIQDCITYHKTGKKSSNQSEAGQRAQVAPTASATTHQKDDIPNGNVEQWYSQKEIRETPTGKLDHITNRQYLDSLNLKFKTQATALNGNFNSYVFHQKNRYDLVAYDAFVIPDYIYNQLDLPTEQAFFGDLKQITSNEQLQVGDKVLYSHVETKVTATYHDKKKVYINYSHNARYLADVSFIKLFPKKPAASPVTEKSPYGIVVEHETYKKGDQVEIAYDGAWHKGVITGFDQLGAGEIDIRVSIANPFHPTQKLDVGGTTRSIRKPKEPATTQSVTDNQPTMQSLQDYEFDFSLIGYNDLGRNEREFISQLRENGATGIENPSGLINGLRFKIGDWRFLLLDNGNHFVLSSFGKGKGHNSNSVGELGFSGYTAKEAADKIYDLAVGVIAGDQPTETTKPVTNTSMYIPSGYQFIFKGLGHNKNKEVTLPAIETALLELLKQSGAKELWNKPRHDNSLIYYIHGHRIEMFFEANEVKMNVTTSLTFAGVIKFDGKTVEQLASDIGTLSTLHYTHRVYERDRKPQYEPNFFNADSAPVEKDIVTADTVGNTDVSAIEMAILAQSIKDGRKKEQKQEKLPDALSFDEVIGLYNPGISANEIKAWVWYKRQFGHPMKGWNKYYISNNKSGKKDAVVTAKDTVEILDNKWQPVRTLAPGTLIGKKLTKEHSYKGITYWIVKNDQQEILFVDASKVAIKDLSYFTEESEVIKLVKAKALVYIDGEYLPIPIYTFANMYERERELEREKGLIIEQFGQDYFDWVKGLIKDNKPNELRIEAKDKAQRPKILCVSKFAVDIEQFGIKELADDTGIQLPKIKRRGLSEEDPENQYSLQEGFVAWLDTKTDHEVPGSNKVNIMSYYIGNKRFPENTPEEEQAEIRANARIACEELFSEFLATGLLYNDQQKVNRIWNETFNAYGSVNKYKVPVGFTCSRTFKNSLMSIRPVQREGIAFMGIVGAGCLAYDVGVGKTLTAIITLAQAIQSGTCDRPVVVVPKPTYNKWKRELFGYYTDGAKKSDNQFKNSTFVTGLLSHTGIKLNDWQNLSTKIVEKLGDALTKKIEPNTITLLTYEGLSQIGFSAKVYDSIFTSLVDILNNGGAEKSARDKAIDYSKYELMMGKGLKKTVCDIDTLGIDYLVVDEAHNFKNVFDAVGKDKEDKRRMLFGLKGAQSERAIKLFFHTNYIQRTHGTNVMLLTATPFTNSPLEIFSMFSFIGYESLRKYNLQNIRRFFETFVLESVEYTVNLREEIVSKPVIKAFNNKQVLQKLLYNHFDYKTGEDAGVVRPCKVSLPLLKEFRDGQLNDLSPDKQITTYLDMTEFQINNQRDVVEEANKNQLENPGSMFRAMAKSLDNALSPHIFASKIPQSDLTAEAFVNESPKIKYVCECIKSVKEYHEARKEPVSGQVIYSNRGKEYFPLLKQYLEDYIGYKKRVEFGEVRLDEVEIIESGLAEAKKDNIKEGFLAGVVKVVIGTATIKEGIDLQNVGTVLYNMYPDWNPTDLKQLEGRIHRQGNQFGYVRIVMPLVVNSMDVFVFQKLEEKTARINSIWYKADKGNTLEMDSIDVEEIKYALIDNPQALAEMKLDKAKAIAAKDLRLAEENKKMYGELKSLIHYYNTYRERLIADLQAKLTKFKYALDNGKTKLDTQFGRPDDGSTSGLGDLSTEQKANKKKIEDMVEKIQKIVDRMEAYLLAVPQDDKDLLEIIRSVNQSNWGEGVYMSFDNWTTNQFREFFSQVKKAEKQILFARNMTIHDDLSELKALLDEDVKSKEDYVKHINSDDFWQQLLQGVHEEMQKRSQTRGLLHEQIAKFKKLNILLSYKSDNVDKDVCALPETECCGFNPDSVVINKLEYRNQVVEVETEEGIEEVPFIETEPATIEEEVEAVVIDQEPTLESLTDAIEALQVMLEMAEDETEIKELKEGIEALEVLVDMDIAA